MKWFINEVKSNRLLQCYLPVAVATLVSGHWAQKNWTGFLIFHLSIAVTMATVAIITFRMMSDAYQQAEARPRIQFFRSEIDRLWREKDEAVKRGDYDAAERIAQQIVAATVRHNREAEAAGIGDRITLHGFKK
jgi:hypothetical protein